MNSIHAVKKSLAQAIQVFCTAGGGAFFGAASDFGVGLAAHPYPSPLHNAAIRVSARIDAGDFMRLLGRVFHDSGRPYVLWVDSEADEDLMSAAVDSGLAPTADPISFAMMATSRPVKMPLPPHLVIERVSSGASANEFASTVCDAFDFDNSQRALVGGVLSSDCLVKTEGVAAYILRINGEPISSAMTISSGPTTGLYYVGTKRLERRSGLATLLVNWATAAAFDEGCSIICLESDPSLSAQKPSLAKTSKMARQGGQARTLDRGGLVR